jgi:YgiT-type zinc finger domain-containing protein
MKMNPDSQHTGEIMSFWEGERCEYCHGAIEERLIDLPRKVGAGYVLIKNVPTGVCQECGTHYYAANVLKTIEETTSGRRKAEQEISMSVYSFAGVF